MQNLLEWEPPIKYTKQNSAEKIRYAFCLLILNSDEGTSFYISIKFQFQIFTFKCIPSPKQHKISGVPLHFPFTFIQPTKQLFLQEILSLPCTVGQMSLSLALGEHRLLATLMVNRHNMPRCQSSPGLLLEHLGKRFSLFTGVLMLEKWKPAD